ncbi:MAG: hypothetical protein GXN93_04845 [Candidatus Diapherotrites archaeon]|nr:hypothetical protein [Candidatus Diapherotrites archaeon]
MLSEVERKVMEVLAERRPRNEQELVEAYLEVLNRLGSEHGYLFRYSHFLRILKNVEAKTQRALDDLELVRKTGLFDPYGRLAFDVDSLFERIKVVITFQFGGIKEVVRDGDLSELAGIVASAAAEPTDA